MRRLLSLFVLLLLAGCSASPEDASTSDEPGGANTFTETGIDLSKVSRYALIPPNATKMTPELDAHPPILHSDGWEEPVPLEGPVNSKGGEDSAFISPDGKTLYFFFTPDLTANPQKQLLDNTTGIWVSRKTGETWSEPERVVLVEKGELSLDGCEFVEGNRIWFCSVRLGNYREIDIWTAELVDGEWTNVEILDEKLNVDYGLGEFHFSSDGNELYYHSDREGTKGGADLWVTRRIGGEWQEPENLEVLNTEYTDGWPYLSQDGSELWFTRGPAAPSIYRSKKINGSWSKPELILETFAGEPSLDNEGNIYFTHHFYKDDRMLDADIYVAYRKK